MYEHLKSLQVVYVCNQGHINVRFWRLPCLVHRKVRCTVPACSEMAAIGESERRRHLKLMTGLDGYLQ